MSRRAPEPLGWLEVANRRRPKLPQTTEWFDGTTHPALPGWYERHFSDSPSIGHASMQWWDGKFWRAHPEWERHWRQVGDYPAWRGLSEDPNKAPAQGSADRAALAADSNTEGK